MSLFVEVSKVANYSIADLIVGSKSFYTEPFYKVSKKAEVTQG